MTSSNALARAISVTVAVCLLAAAMVTAVALPQAAHAASGIGGPISRSEVIARAKDWMQKNPAYCESNDKAHWQKSVRPGRTGGIDVVASSTAAAHNCA